MPLHECPDCGKEVSDKAYSCPNCARPLRPRPEAFGHQTLRYGLALLVLLLIVGIFYLGLRNAPDKTTHNGNLKLTPDQSTQAAAVVKGAETKEAKTSALLTDARAVSQKYWDARFTKCGDHWYEFDYPGQTPVMLRQLKDVTVTTIEESLTDVDKMNGVEWKGTTTVSANMHRTLPLNSTTARWNEWRGGMPPGGTQNFVYLKRKNSKWSFDPDEQGFFKHLNCSTIPR